MSKYIEKSTMKQYIRNFCKGLIADNRRFDPVDDCALLCDVVNFAPNADVVKVVRCNDCIFSRELRTDIEKETYCKGVVMCNNGVWGTELAVWGDNFCSYGEERE